MMEKYRLVEEYRGEGDDFLEEEQSSIGEVRITHLGKPKNYITYAMSLFVSSGRNIMVCIVRLFSFCSLIFFCFLTRLTENEPLY